MNGRWLASIPVLAGILVLALTPAALQADEGFVAPHYELPLTLTSPTTSGARAAGMGFVSTAVVDDATAILTNPAALTRLNRVELSGGFKRSSSTVEGVMSGDGFSSELSSTDFTSLRFAYPFPTFRGSLVFALSSERVYDLSADWLAAYEAEVPWDEDGDVWRRQEDYLADGGINALSAACGMDVSPKISLGVAVSYLHGDYSRAFVHSVETAGEGPDYSYRSLTDFDSDVTGLRATFGALFYISEQVSAGVAFDSPTTLTFDGTAGILIEEGNEFSTVVDSALLFSDEVSLPFSFRGGVSYAPTDLVLVAADVTYSDWSEVDYAGRITEIEDTDGQLLRRSFYQDKMGFGLGAELTVPSWPLRIRAGYASRPIAYDGLEVVSDRTYLTMGAGVLIDTVLAIDVAWVGGSYKRSDADWGFEEKVDDSAIIMEATYRF